jgi:hypothetical protein
LDLPVKESAVHNFNTATPSISQNHFAGSLLKKPFLSPYLELPKKIALQDIKCAYLFIEKTPENLFSVKLG